MSKALDDYISSHQPGSDPVDEPEKDQEPVVDEPEKDQEPVVDDNQVTEPDSTTTEPVNDEPDKPDEPGTVTGIEIDDEQLNTFFETTDKTKDDFRKALELSTKYPEIEGKNKELLQEIEDLRQSNAELKKGLDPLSYFSSEQAYVAEQLRKKYPDMDPVAIQTAITRDLNKMSDLDVLALQDVIKYPGASGGEAMAKKIIADDYGVDPSEPIEQWDDMARAKIQRAAIDARNVVKQLQSEVELPSIKSEEQLAEERAEQASELKASWKPFVEKLTGFDKITIPGLEDGTPDYDFHVPDTFRESLPEFFNEMITNGELEPNKETIKFLMEQRNKDFVYQNLGKIRQALEKDIRSDIQKKTDEELNNTDPANTQTKPVVGDDEGGTSKWLQGRKGRFRT